MKEFEHVQVESRAEWHAWLEQNHRQSDGIWLIIFKKHVPDKWMPWADLVDEALCFGWIDSRTRRLDEDRTMYLVSPRRPGSPWSAINKQRVEQLIAEGHMQPAGLAMIERAKADGSWHLYDEIEQLIVPEDLAAALAENEAAARNFDAFDRASKKSILWWIKSAKTAPTRRQRIEKTVQSAEQNQRANQLAPRGNEGQG